MVAFHKEVARRDLSLTHTIVQPTIDKTRGDVPAAGDEVALHKVENTAHGIVVRGARILATLAPFSDELFVYPSATLAAGTAACAPAFSIPIDPPGLMILFRGS